MSKQQRVMTNTYYQEKYRPHVHFTPESMWMNDPNGLVYFEEEYHLFYQYHPDGKTWGPMHWGHAVSRDLLTWRHLPLALFPDEIGMIFSGSVVVDWNNTSGFFKDGEPGLVAIFTHATGDLQRQSVAYSKDNGRTWEKYVHNPVIDNDNITDFRDPKVFWHEDSSQWIMVLTIGRRVRFYASNNLIDWFTLSDFGENWGAQDGVWECPDLFMLTNEDTEEKKWVLQIGVDDGAYAGGSGTQYFVGNFDGTVFTPDQNPSDVRWIDVGKDFYAAQSFSDMPDDRRIIIAWMSNWTYAEDIPTDPWRSAMTLPRELKLCTIDGCETVVQQPVSELTQLRSVTHDIGRVAVSRERPFRMRQPNAPFEIEFDIEHINGKLECHFFKTGKESFIFSIDNEKSTIERKHFFTDDFSDSFYSLTSAPLPYGTPLRLRAVCDHSSVEWFINDGTQTSTHLFFPTDTTEYNISFQVQSGDVNIKDLSIYELQSVWSNPDQ
ncbi:glycoside hydrolase family 32 protein [Salibacterium salarium]|uniref:Glycoside hydrolase family 32 protein n=1 Tax=Salibacterium salarium TaxID=284579 RepID=A0A3R9QN20_9BACI|nr:glycoside hydrolase family 32 protein [Salibacterium salarium]RSL33900.1 glycoside hydrolase family 32 protein [Salibacterium salarium]